MNTVIYIVIIYFLSANFFGWVIMWSDKRKAIKQLRRIPEKRFWQLAWLGGAIGLYLGMKMWHHKTRKAQFKWGIPFLVLYNIAMIVLISTYLS